MRVERHHQQPVGDLGRGPGHHRAERAEQHRRRTERVRAGDERRRHQRVLGVLAPEVQPGAVLPGGQDRLHRQHDLPHPRRGGRPRRAVPLLDVRLDLRPEPEPEPAAAHQLQVPRGVREVHRRARHRDRHVGHQVGGHPRRRGRRQRQEHVVRPLEREQPGRPGVDQLTGAGRGLVGPAVELYVEEHVRIVADRPAGVSSAGRQTSRWDDEPSSSRREFHRPADETHALARRASDGGKMTRIGWPPRPPSICSSSSRVACSAISTIGLRTVVSGGSVSSATPRSS